MLNLVLNKYINVKLCEKPYRLIIIIKKQFPYNDNNNNNNNNNNNQEAGKSS